MSNDDLRVSAKLLALTVTIRALIGEMRDRDPNAVGALAHGIDDLIRAEDEVGDEMKYAAIEFRRKVLFEPPY